MHNMWPTSLDMTRDECRGILRRMELETYSNVVSTFRAQGILTDSKTQMLDNLRAIFHISQDRHRGEARRAANDEHLTTIADILSECSSNYEWGQEGRRPFPVLPRSAPNSAIRMMADVVAEATSQLNNDLPLPSETVTQRRLTLSKNSSLVVKEDPMKDTLKVVIPEQATQTVHVTKRDLKRAFVDAGPPPILILPAKKRTNLSSASPLTSPSPMTGSGHSLPLPAGRIQQLYNNQAKTQNTPRQRKPNAKKPGPKPKGDGQKTPRQSKTKTRKEPPVTPTTTSSSVSQLRSVPTHSASSVMNPRVIHSYATSSLPSTSVTTPSSTAILFDQDEIMSGELLVPSPSKVQTDNSETLESQTPETHVKVLYTTTSINSSALSPIGSASSSALVLDQPINHQPITEQTPITWLPKTPQVPPQNTSLAASSPILPTVASPVRPFKIFPMMTTPSSAKKTTIIMPNNGNIRKITPLKLDIEKGVTMSQKKTPMFISASPAEANVAVDENNQVPPTIATMISPTGAIIDLPTQARILTSTASTNKGNAAEAVQKSNKIQIKSQIIINPGGTNPTVKLSSSSFRNLQSKSNFKLISAEDGKVLLQNDNTKKMFAQRLANASGVTTVSPAQSLPNNKKVSLQVMKGTGKPNIIHMPGGVVTLGNGHVNKTIRGFTKDGKFIIQPTAINKTQSNVIVLDMKQTQKNTEKSTGSLIEPTRDNRITEDTPVDILPATPSIVNYVLKPNQTSVVLGTNSVAAASVTSHAEPSAGTVQNIKEISTTDWEMELDQSIQKQQRVADVTSPRRTSIVIKRKNSAIVKKPITAKRIEQHIVTSDDLIEYVGEERLDEGIQMQDDDAIVENDDMIEILREEHPFTKENGCINTESNKEHETSPQDIILCDYVLESDDGTYLTEEPSQCSVTE